MTAPMPTPTRRVELDRQLDEIEQYAAPAPYRRSPHA